MDDVPSSERPTGADDDSLGPACPACGAAALDLGAIIGRPGRYVCRTSGCRIITFEAGEPAHGAGPERADDE